VRHACVTCDADYGDNPHFLNGLEQRGERHVVAVRADFSVTRGRGPQSPVRRAAAVLAAQPRPVWHTIAWRGGAQGWWRAKFVALRCGRVDGDGTRHVGWLMGQRPGRGQHGDWKYYWSDFPTYTPWLCWSSMPIVATGWSSIMKKRKRSWDGFHRHAIMVMLSYSFLVWLEGRQRQQCIVRGRPRSIFSPASGPPADAASRGPSPGK
jgi:hypothetical protein